MARCYSMDNLQRPDRGRSIVLIGFMGSGKSAVGAELSRRSGAPLIDTDTLLEEREQMTISEIFAAKGQPYFRRAETDLLTELAGREEMYIYSTGGGMPLREDNHEPLRRIGTIVYLTADTDTFVKRLSGDKTRPLLQTDKPLRERIEELLTEREPIYRDLADLLVKNPFDRPVGEIAEEILAKV